MPRKKQESELEQSLKTVVESMAVLTSELKLTNNRVLSLEGKLEKPLVKHTQSVTTENKVEVTTNHPSQPVPVEYRELVDSILNHLFGIRVQSMSDTPSFSFTIVVPEKYSDMSPSYKEMYKEDIRPKVISYSEGLNGVREWTERVFKRFNPDVQALITSDRLQFKTN